MADNERFITIEGDLFPEVINYDFDENKVIRGIDQRTFRWQEVFANQYYIFQESTSGSAFEGVGSSGILTSSATIGGEDNLLNFSSWMLTGAYIYGVNVTGLVIPTGAIPSVTSSITLHPITDTGALALYVPVLGVDAFTGCPLIYQDFALDELEMPINGRYQVYIEARPYYTYSQAVEPASITSYLAIVNPAGVPQAYYDFSGKTWSDSVPNSKHILTPNEYNYIKYDLYTSGYVEGLDLNRFRFYVTSKATGSMVVIDNIHIDQYLIADPYIDYIVPTGYVVQMTPDLGWPDTLAMFEERENILNPHLKYVGPFSPPPTGTLIDRLDGSVQVTLSETELDNLTINNYNKYLWRAVAISDNGIYGKGGFPQKFEFIGIIKAHEFTIDDVYDEPHSLVKTISGTRSNRMRVLVDDKEHIGMEYPTPSSWKLTIMLDRSELTIAIKALDDSGASSHTTYVTLTTNTHIPQERAMWNVFDDHGLLVDVARLPDESNKKYSDRIVDSFANPGGPSYLGVTNGAIRELGLNRVNDSLMITIENNQYGTPLSPEGIIEITGSSLRIYSPNFVYTEFVRCAGVYGDIQLRYRPYNLPLFIELDTGSKIDLSDVLLPHDADDNPFDYKLHINNPSALGKFVKVSYQHYYEFRFKDYPTLYSLLKAINSIKDQSGAKVFNCTLSDKLSGSENPFGLFAVSGVIQPGKTTSLKWSPFVLRKINDRTYRDHFKNPDGSLNNTKYYTYIKELKENTNVFWGYVEADNDFWDAAYSSDEGFDVIPTLFDPYIGSFYTTNKKFDPQEAWARGYIGVSGENISNNSINYGDFHPGVAYKPDLEPSIVYTSSQDPVVSDGMSVISNEMKDNKYIIFSGQN